MKQVRSLIIKILQNQIIWKIVKPFVKLGKFLEYCRNYPNFHKRELLVLELKDYLEIPIVRNGPFKGMKFPDFKDFGDAIFAKIIGCYEAELHQIIEKLLKQDYEILVNIGSAEGYYAVGFALKIPKLKVFAYEINPEAQKYIKEMAKLNKVSERIFVKGKCTKEELLNYVNYKKGLIICDVEGDEKFIFDSEIAKMFSSWNLIIETHNFIIPDISSYLIDVFNETHSIDRIFSLDDITKAKIYKYPELENLEYEKKLILVSEHRPFMEWLIMTPKNF